MTWRPIETAPRDGTVVDLWVVRDGHGERFAGAEWDASLGMWFNEYLYSPHPEAKPTHWQSIPPPPDFVR